MTGTSFELGKLRELFKFCAFRVTKKNLILYHDGEKIVVPRKAVKFNCGDMPLNQVCYVRREEK